jgi:Ca2+-binding EF-hand superfamily protein
MLAVKGKGRGRGWVQAYGKKGHEILREANEEVFCINLSDKSDKKLKYQVLSQEFYDNYIFNSLEDAMADWEEEHDLAAEVDSESELSGSDYETSGDGLQSSDVAVVAVVNAESKDKKGKKGKKGKKQADNTAVAAEAKADAEAEAEAQAEADADAAEMSDLTAANGVVTREDLNQLGALMGVALTKREIDAAMLEMDPSFVPIEEPADDEDGADSPDEGPDSPRANASAALPAPGSEGRIPFKVFNAWFEEIDVYTGEPLEYTDEIRRSDVLVKIKTAKQALEAKATATKLSRLKSIGMMSGMSVDDPPSPAEMEISLFEALDDNLIGEFNWDEFTYLPTIADLELDEEALAEAWLALDPNDTGFVTQQAYSRWYNSLADFGSVLDLMRKDENGALATLGIEYRNRQKVGGRGGVTSMIKSADAGKISAVMSKSTAGMLRSRDATQTRVARIVYKEDVEQVARKKAEEDALVHEDAWRDGLTVLSEIDREDLLGMRVDVETFGKGTIAAVGKGKVFMVQFDPGTPLGKKKMAMAGMPTKLKLPSKKYVFTVLSPEFITSYVEQSVNKAIHRWATHESKIRSKVDAAARTKVMAKKGAWTAGTDIEDPEDILDRRITIKGYGQGTVVDYNDEGAQEEKGKWGEHMIEFDSGTTSALRLDKSSGLKYKVLNTQYVEALCKAELKKWQDGRRRLTATETALKEREDAEQAKSSKLMQLRDVKSKMQGQSGEMTTTADRAEDLETQLRTLKEIFDRFDHDLDGNLDREEFDQLCSEMGFRGTDSQLEDAWGELDQGEKGQATFKDLSDFFQSDLLTTIAGALLRNQIAARIVSYRQDVILLHRLFVKYDESHSGHLDFEEFTKLSDSLNFQGTEDELRASYSEIDTAGSGFIEFEEFRAFFIQHEIDLGDTAGRLLEMMKDQLDAEKIDGDTLRRVFAKHDPDGNGYLDNFEFDVLAQELGYNGTEEDMQDLFSQMDKDNNGLIDWDEFVAYFGAAAKVDGKAGKVASDLRRNLFTKFTETSLDLRGLRDVFDGVDKKQLAKINGKQFAKAAKSLGWTEGPEELQESFIRANKDGSGELTWEEFREWYMAKNPDAVALMMRDVEGHDEMAKASLEEFFNSHDSDGNGNLSQKEFISMARELGLESDKGELKHMFKVMDLDRSETIEFDEFLAWYEDNTDGEMLKRVKGIVGNDRKTVRQRKILKTMFQRVDVDGSGEVDAREILQLALDLGVEITLQEMHLIFGEIDLDGSGAIDFDEFAQWYLLKGGRGDVLRRRLREWYKQIDSANDAQVVSISFERGKGLQGTKRVKGKVTYYFSRISGAYSEISSFAESQLTLAEKTGFSTIDKLVYLHQTQLFNTMELSNVLRVAQVCEQINLTEGEVLYEDADEGHAAYFIMNGSMLNCSSGVEVMVSYNDKPFGEQTLLSPHKRTGSMVAAEDTTLLCLFQVPTYARTRTRTHAPHHRNQTGWCPSIDLPSEWTIRTI